MENKEADLLIGQLIKAKDNAPDTIGLWAKVVDTFGGQDNFAVAAKRIFDACEVGSAQQVRMMSMFFDLCKTAADKAEKSDPVDEMTPEQLRAALNHFMQEAVTDGARQPDD